MTVSFAESVLGGTRRIMLPNGEQIDVKIPAGLKDGQQIRVKGRGGAGRNGGPNGDVLIQVDGRAASFHQPRRQRSAHGPAGDLEGGGAGRQGAGADIERHASIFPFRANSNTGAVLRLKGKGVPAHGGYQRAGGRSLCPAGGRPAGPARCRA